MGWNSISSFSTLLTGEADLEQVAEIVFDFFDALKSRTRGYASLDYDMDGEQSADLVKVDILLNGDKVC